MTKGGEDDPNKKTWTRIAALSIDPRTEKHSETVMRNLRIDDDTTELESVFWKFVCDLIKHLDQTPRHERNREDHMVDPSLQCVQIRLGLKKIVTGINKGTMRAVQGRCASCRARNKRQEKRGRAPNTAWGCVCHPGEYFCKNKTCWSEHLRQVRLNHEVEMEI